MAHKTVKQPGPDWLPRAVVCRVTMDEGSQTLIRNIVRSSSPNGFVDTDGRLWFYAEPIAEWEPVADLPRAEITADDSARVECAQRDEDWETVRQTLCIADGNETERQYAIEALDRLAGKETADER